jgi:thiol-disulfide isomerase/thioredoxin
MIGLTATIFLGFIACKDRVSSQRFSCEPKNPEPGKTIEVYYNPSGTALQDAGSIEMAYYVCIPGSNDARSSEMRRLNHSWTAAINLEENALAVAFRFVSGDRNDSNGDKGYTILLKDNEGNILPGAKGALSDLLINWRAEVGVIRTRVMKTAALQNIKEDIEAHPEFRKYFLGTYYYLLKDLKVEEGVKEIVADVKKNAGNEKLSANELSAMLAYCEDPELQDIASVLRQRLMKKNPRDEFFFEEKIKGYAEITDPLQKEKFINNISKSYKNDDYTSFLQTSLLDEYMKSGNIADAVKYLESSNNYSNSSLKEYFSSLLLKNPKYYVTALDFSSLAVTQKQKEIRDGVKPKPANKTKKEWTEQADYELGKMLGTHGKALLLNGKKKEALNTLERSIALTGYANETINEYYAKALVETENFNKALSETEKFILNGNSTPEMNSILKLAYTKEKSGEAGFDEYIADLEMKAKANRMSRIKSEMLDIKAPDFTLEDMQGKKISLKDFRGKSLVIDFWATWCPPCRASFPFLKKLVESRKDDDNVSFVFINTRDHERQRKERIAKFLKDNQYPFHVLLDNDIDKTNDEFVIPGLPTKVFIDKNGVIRFLMFGWEGEEKKELEKITTILDLIK